MDKLTAIIVAGGVGKRMGRSVPKQFLLLGDRPILMHTIEKFATAYNHIDLDIIVVMHTDYQDYWKDLIRRYDFDIPHTLAEGGKERFFSVRNGLKLSRDNGLIAVHDGVRPLISIDFLQKIYEEALHHGNAVPYIRPKSSVRIEKNGHNYAIDRNTVRLIQTPQFFPAAELKQAYNQTYKSYFTDDATVYESYGKTIHLIEGEVQNIKITTEIDLYLAEIILSKAGK